MLKATLGPTPTDQSALKPTPWEPSQGVFFCQKVPASFSDMRRISEKEAGTFWRDPHCKNLNSGQLSSSARITAATLSF